MRLRSLVRTSGRLTAVALLGALLVMVLPAVSQSASAARSCTTAYGQAAAGDGWSASEHLTRTFGNGTAPTTNCFHLTADRHTDLQDHERIKLTWSGAHPTGGRSLNPYGENGLPQEYPVVLLECRGVDPKNGSAGGHEQVSPQTCWTNTYFQRSASGVPGGGIWQQDADAPAADKGHVSGIPASRIPASCGVSATLDYHITPFLAANKKFYPGCSSSSMPPEAAVNSVSIPNEAAAFTNTDGNGTFDFEVRTNVDNESLGCSASVPCTLEVIPIDGIDCAPGNTSDACNATGQLPAGQVNPGFAPEDAVAPAFWWSASNWNRRIPVPLSFATPPSVCSAATAGSPVPFYGSELLSQAALQWTPAYCLNRSRFNWQDNIMPDQAAFTLMKNGAAAAAEVSSRGENDAGVGYAPTAATGWGIGFDVDEPGNAGQRLTLNLDARLLAKLLTESYPGSIPTRLTHPGFATNPLSINLDPEFQKLNPGLDTSHWNEAAAVLMDISTSSDVVRQMTSYIAADPQAMAFIHGQADPWGMKVNPYYKNIALPVSTWPLLDKWVNTTTSNSCLHAAQTAYMPLMSNPVSSLRLVATALLYNWPYVGTGCTGTGTQNDPFQLGRVAPEGVGNRFLLGVVTLGDAARYGLPVARLQAEPGHFVAADDAGLSAALKLAKKGSGLTPFTLDQSAIRSSSTAYPGTTVVYTAAKTTGLPKPTAAKVAEFIRVSSTEGQAPGRGNGRLAAGYLPLQHTGVTAPLFDQAQRVAAAVAAQKATPSGSASAPPGSGGTPTGTPGGGGGLPGTVPGSGTPSTAPTAAPGGSTAAATGPVVRTALVSSPTSGRVLPWLLAIALVSGLITAAGRLWLFARGGGR